MSNPQTYYTCGGVDLSSIFQPYSGGTKTPLTNFNVSGYGDLNNIFDPSSNGEIITYDTGYLANGVDLRYYFAGKKNQYIYITNQNQNISLSTSYTNGYYIVQFTNNGIQDVNWSTATCDISFLSSGIINVILVGRGGGGGFGGGEGLGGIERASGGGGGGGSFSLNQISIIENTNYTLTVGSGGVSYINSNQDGQASSLIGQSLNLYQPGGSHGGNASQGSTSGGSSYNGGNGGNGGTQSGQSGQNGNYAVYVTQYGSTLNLGGGGGGGYGPNSLGNCGSGYGALNGIGGQPGIKDVNIGTLENGSGFGAGGGGGGGLDLPSGMEGSGSSGGIGGNGLVIIYFNPY